MERIENNGEKGSGFLPIILGIKRSASKKDDPEKEHSDPKFAKQKAEFISSSGFCCAFCGFKSSLFQSVHHLDLNHSNNSKENYAVACPLCHACFHIGHAGASGGGIIIYWPEVSQMAINRIVRSLFVAQKIKLPFYEKVIPTIWNGFKARGDMVKKTWGTNDPSEFAASLQAMGDSTYEEVIPKLDGLRFVISPKSKMLTPEMIDHWAKVVVEKDPSSTQGKSLMQAIARVANG